MSGPIVYVDSSEIRAGKLEALKAAMKELAGFVEANEPRLLAYEFYISETTDRMTVVALHPDSAAMEHHLELAGPAFRGFAELMRLERIDVYGTISEELLERLRRKASLLGSGTVVTHERHAGFVRFGGR